MDKLSSSTESILKPRMLNSNILQMKTFNQHKHISTYDHCVHVTVMSLYIAEKLKLSDGNMRNIIVGGLLHDYFLYDWHDGRRRKEGIHCFSHPQVALNNAMSQFKLNAKQKNIIRSHMFPATLLHPPKCIEATIVCIADKLCAITEYAGLYNP